MILPVSQGGPQGPHTNSRIHVVHVLPSLRSGGTENRVQRMISASDKSSFRVSLLALTSRFGSPKSLAADESEVVVLEQGSVGRWLPCHLKLAALIWRFARTLGEMKPDVIHAHLPAPNIYSAVARLTTCRRARLIVSKASLGNYKKGRPFLRMAERWANGVADRIMVNSHAVEATVIREENTRGDKIVLMYNGVDTDEFSPRELSPTGDWVEAGRGPTLVTVANLHAYKGHGVLLRAMPAVVAQYPHCLLLCVGEDRGEKPRLLELADQLGIATRVRFLGHQDDVAAILRACDIVVHPSLQEGFSNAVLEAMACGRPVVASSAGGTAEAVVDGETGYLVDPGDSVALGEAILRMLADPQRAAEMGAAGRARAVQTFSIGRAVDELESLYATLGRANKTRRPKKEKNQR